MKGNRPDELISLLMDGELEGSERERLIQELETNTRFRLCLERYQLISDTIKQHLPHVYRHDLSQRVSRAIAAENPHQTPPRREPSHITWRVTGFALAASLAALAVIGIQWTQPGLSPVGSPQLAASPAAADLMLPAPAGRMGDIRLVAEGESPVPVVAGRSPVAVAGNRPLTSEQIAGRSRLTEYLINHNEYASTISVREGLLPHVRVVGYDSGE